MQQLTFSKFYTTLKVLGIAILLSVLFLTQPIHSQENSEATDDETSSQQEAENQESEYSYTVQPGDGVTHMLLDFAEKNGRELSPAQAYEIAQSNGAKLLELGITTQINAPYTENIGGFAVPGVVISAAENEEFFTELQQQINETGQAASEGDVTADDDSGEPQTTTSDEAQEETADEESEDEESGWLSQNWWLLAVILFGGAAIWYFFVNPAAETD